jgi:hypothetical protein
MKALLKWILFVIIIVAVAVFAWVVFPGPQIRLVWQAANTAPLPGPQGPVGESVTGPKGDTGPAMDPATLLADPAFKEVINQAVAAQVAQAQSAVIQPAPAVQPATGVQASTLAPCSLSDGGVQLQLTQVGDEWIFDPAKPVVVNRYAGTHDASQLLGCNFIAEGRKILVQEHHIWVIRSGGGALNYLDADGMFRAKEMSVYAYPINWQMDPMQGETKLSISEEFQAAKQLNQLRNGYDWPDFIHLTDGTTITYAVGKSAGIAYTSCKDITEPKHMFVTGIVGSTTYTASIGAEGCWTAAKIDGSWTHWRDAKDNVVFKTVDTWLMPSTFTEQNTLDWIAAKQ